MKAFCRDCFAVVGEDKRCPACRSPRIARHPELDSLAIAHLDCDAFYAAIEKRDHPELADKPLIIGGGQRGVVSTACYIARTYGVHSAMPMFKAKRACPDAVVMPPNMTKYAEVGREIREMMRATTPLVEPLSIDEAFLDLSGTDQLHGHPPAITMAALAKRIEKEIGITVSIGLSYNKFLAKVASDLDKPRGFSVIGRAEAVDFLARQPVSLIWGVGKALQNKLAGDGISRIGQLQTMDENDLMKRYGVMGRRLARLSRGLDDRTVKPNAEMKSVSAETTFNTDKADFDDLSAVLWRLAEKVSRRCKAQSIAGSTVTLKLKTAAFRTRTRSRSLHEPTQLAERIYRTAEPLLRKEADGTPFRLIGVGVSSLAPAEIADPDDLLDPQSGKRARAERAIDDLRARFGGDAIGKGRGMKNRSEPRG